jgi:hypothetical protein
MTEVEGMYAIQIPPGAMDIGASLDKTSYSKVGFCADVGRGNGPPVIVRVAWHWVGGGWGVGRAEMTADNPKAIVNMSGKIDSLSFCREDDSPITVYPNVQ